MLNHKSQITNYKLQITKQKKFCNSLFGHWVLFGIWCLVLVFSTNCYALNLNKAKESFLNKDYSETIAECERILAVSGYSKDLDELYYILALSYMKEGNLLRASDIFEIIIKEFKNSRFRNRAKIGLGDIYFLKQDYSQASNSYEKILSESPNTRFRSLVIYRLAQSHLKQGNWQQANDYLAKLNNDYSLSFVNNLAKGLSRQEDFFTVQVGAFSKFENAENLCAKLKDNGYSAYIKFPESGAAKTYRVRVGKMNSLNEAKRIERQLIEQGYPTKIFP